MRFESGCQAVLNEPNSFRNADSIFRGGASVQRDRVDLLRPEDAALEIGALKKDRVPSGDHRG